MVAQPPLPREKQELHRTIRSLNSDFQLGLAIPDANISPDKHPQLRRTEEEVRVGTIYKRALFLSLNNPGRLSTSIGRFRTEADQFLRQWVTQKQRQKHKHADTPTSEYLDPLRASPGFEERAALQKLLLDLLRNDGPSRHRPTPNCPNPSKRMSPEFPGPVPKRPRAKATGHNTSLTADSIDDIPVRTRSSIRVAPAAQPQSADADAGTTNGNVYSASSSQSRTSFSTRSVTSSKTSFVASSVFSATSRHDNSSSQVTAQSSFNGSSQSTQPFQSQTTPNIVNDRPRAERLWQNSLPSSSAPPCERLPSFSRISTPIGKPASFRDELQPAAASDPLANIWPKFPAPYLNRAPVIIVWELARAAAHCGVDLAGWDLEYQPDDSWHDQAKFRFKMITHPIFLGKGLPPSCVSQIWKAALTSFAVGPKIVALSADLDLSEQSSNSTFQLRLKPPYLKLGYRLSRRFGADRFLEVLLPSGRGQKAQDHEQIVQWLSEKSHYFLGRTWVPFFTNEGTKVKKKDPKDPMNPGKVINIVRERAYFFAIDGINFRMPKSKFPPLEEALNASLRTKMKRSDLLGWALNLDDTRNAKQPIPKLFSRLALNVSNTCPTVILERDQIFHREHDLLGELNGLVQGEEAKVMNDGVGRMSRSLARKVATQLGLSDTPCGYQARIGSAKGMWIVDVNDDGLDNTADWIETYPSQRKWECDFQDIHHRTFEVRDWPRELRSASLNQQFIPVLEQQSLNRLSMRQTMEKYLVDGLRKEIDEQKDAMKHPLDFRAWVKRNSGSSKDSFPQENVQFSGGLPDREEDVMAYLLDAGFTVDNNQFLADLAWESRKRHTELLKSKMNIKIPRSTYALMVIDFTGTLEEGEVQLAFSSKFQVEEDSETLLDGIDVLVARSPAHFVSDIQKVKAVFKPALRKLKDVIVFSSKGNTPLADLLSGGDYDGDRAWVCWDPEVVRNFANAPVPDQPDLIKLGYLEKKKETFQSMIDSHDNMDDAAAAFLRSAIIFSMQPPLLGVCTNYKDRLCYYENSVSSERAVALSTLVGLLVDQSKQGLVFTNEDFSRLRRDMKMQAREPEYLKERSRGYRRFDNSVHILDFLKFEVANNTIENSLSDLFHIMNPKKMPHWDDDLTQLYREFKQHNEISKTITTLLAHLDSELDNLAESWSKTMGGNNDDNYKLRLKSLFDAWVSIEPPGELVEKSRVVQMYLDSWNGDPALNKWNLLKASTFFYKYHPRIKMMWRLAGQQLCWMKAMASRAKTGQSAVAVTSGMWSVLKPDAVRIKMLANRREDNESIGAIEETMDYDEEGIPLDDV